MPPLSEIERAKQVIAEIVRCAGGELIGTSRLYKAFYFAHLFYAERAPDYLTSWPIVKMPNGPGIDQGEMLLATMSRAGMLQTRTTKVGPYPATAYRISEQSFPGQGLSNVAIEAIRDAVNFVKDKTAAELSELTHENSRSWNAAKEGQSLNIYIDQIADDEFEMRQADLSLLNRDLIAAWKSNPNESLPVSVQENRCSSRPQ
jgi:hypothetical protein